jgi:hypothetical protein
MSPPTAPGKMPLRHWRGRLLVVLAVGAALMALGRVAHATPAKCADAIAKAADRYLQQRGAELARCADRALRAGDVAAASACGSAPATLARMTAFEASLQVKIARACGGTDQVCGNADDEPLAAIGWNVGTCPDLAGAGCTMPIADCGSIAQCVACTTASATGLLAGASASDLATSTAPGTWSCQRALAKASDRFFRAAAKALTGCERSVAASTLIGPCPGPASSKASVKLATLARQAATKVCRACGGGDRACDAAVGGLPAGGGGDDPAATAITTSLVCDDVVPPSSGVSCAAPLSTATDVVACAGCVTRFASECATSLASRTAGAYPDSCRGTATPPDECPGCMLWSDPATWGGAVPAAGQDVVIPAGWQVLLDQDTAALGGLTVNGTLRFARQDLALTADWIMVHGTLAIGSETQPFTQRAFVTLTGAPGENVMGMGTRGILVMGGTLEMHGAPPAVPWTKLGAHAATGATSLQLAQAVDWAPGDEIVVAPTDFYGASATEQLQIASAAGSGITTTGPLAAARWGVLQYATASGMALVPDGSIVPPLASTPLVLDERAEVGNLTRNIVVASPDDTPWQTQGFGAHVMIMGTGGTAHVDGVEFRRGGQRGLLGRYPFHWHMLSYSGATFLGDTTGQYLRRSTVNHSANRGVVIHGTNGVEVSDNVIYDVRGHAVFTEDAVERRNTIDGNLALHVRNPSVPLKQHEVFENGGSSGFWIANPDNTVTNNTAADAQGFGFWLAFPNHPFGLNAAVPMRPSRMLFGEFDGNTAHTSGFEGLMFDNVENDESGTVVPYAYQSTIDGNDPTWNSGTLRRFAISNFTTWKNRRGGIWDRVVWPDITGTVSADNCGRFFAGSGADGVIEGSLIVGTSLNVTPRPAFAFDDTLGGDETPTAFATYHSSFDLRDNVIIQFPLVPGQRSGAFATEDYYIRPVDKGQQRNHDNLLIGSHPGYRSSPVLDSYVLAGALWDPYGLWGPAGDFFVYDDPFFTFGSTVTPVVPAGQTGGVSVPGPFYGLLEFVVDNLNAYYEPYMEIRAARLDPVTLAEVGSWHVDAAYAGLLLAPMRHVAAQAQGVYRLDFPGGPLPHDLEVRVENLLETSDTLLVALQFDGSVAPHSVYTVGSGAFALYQEQGSLAAVRDSAGGTWWQDETANVVWVKLRGGSWQWWDQTYTIAVPTSDQLLYESTVLHVNTD